MKCPDSQIPKSDEWCISRGYDSWRYRGPKCEIKTEEVKPSSSALVCGFAGQKMASQKLQLHEVDFSFDLGVLTVVDYTHKIPEGTINEHPHRDYCNACPPSNTPKKQCGTCVANFQHVVGCAEVWYAYYKDKSYEACYSLEVEVTCGDDELVSNMCNQDCL